MSRDEADADTREARLREAPRHEQVGVFVDERKRALVAKSLEPTDAAEALRLHNEVVALTAELSAAPLVTPGRLGGSNQ